MNKGTLAFAIDGVYFGVAFEDERLKVGNGPVWPAISLLHKAGCTLVSGKEPPNYFFEWFISKSYIETKNPLII